jgi:hypothetical protein
MIYIAHRGNTNGINPDKENHPDYLMSAIQKGYDVELDIWLIGNKYILGHDAPQYEIESYFLENDKFWCHAKNLEAVAALLEPGFPVHVFFHDTDACTITSQKWIWTYPGYPVLGHRSIAVMPERTPGIDLSKAGGICTDFPIRYQLGKY